MKVHIKLTSQWRRCRDTAVLLGLGKVEDQPELNSFFRDASTRRAQTLITALTGVFPASGEILVTRLEDGRLRALARIKTAAR